MIMSFCKIKYFLSLSCCVFFACNNKEQTEDENNVQNEKLGIIKETTCKVTAAEQKEKAITQIDELAKMFLDKNVNAEKNKQQSQYSIENLTYDQSSKQKETIDKIVSSIYLNFQNALQNGKNLNYESISKSIEKIKKAESRCCFVIELFNLANNLDINQESLNKWKIYFPFEFCWKDLSDSDWEWLISYFDCYTNSYESKITFSISFIKKNDIGYTFTYDLEEPLDKSFDSYKNALKTFVQELFGNEKKSIEDAIKVYEKYLSNDKDLKENLDLILKNNRVNI